MVVYQFQEVSHIHLKKLQSKVFSVGYSMTNELWPLKTTEEDEEETDWDSKPAGA